MGSETRCDGEAAQCICMCACVSTSKNVTQILIDISKLCVPSCGNIKKNGGPFLI